MFLHKIGGKNAVRLEKWYCSFSQLEMTKQVDDQWKLRLHLCWRLSSVFCCSFQCIIISEKRGFSWSFHWEQSGAETHLKAYSVHQCLYCHCRLWSNPNHFVIQKSHTDIAEEHTDGVISLYLYITINTRSDAWLNSHSWSVLLRFCGTDWKHNT